MTGRVSFETLGCKLNQYETDAIAAGFRALGWEIVGPRDPADARIVNTCTVTDKADRKSHHALVPHLGDGVPLVVTGCFAESARETLEALGGVTFVVPNARKNQIPALVDAHFRHEVAAPNLPPPDPFGFPVHERVFHTRASLKVQDGCDNFCTFCIIPSVRGPGVSRPLDAVVAAARDLVASGRKELVLTGVNLGHWREGNRTFVDLVAALLALEGDFRLRITSLEPDGLGPDFLRLLGHPKMCPHLHLCLQSASEPVLASMGRRHTAQGFQRLVDDLRAARPDLNLTTDLIVGFPGETDEDFDRSLGAVGELGFGAVHVFPFSSRAGTAAAALGDQVTPGVKARRRRLLQDEADRVKLDRWKALAGAVRRVLVETPGDRRGWRRGLTEDYFPVRFAGTTAWNSFVTVRILGVVREVDGWVLEAVPEGSDGF